MARATRHNDVIAVVLEELIVDCYAQLDRETHECCLRCHCADMSMIESESGAMSAERSFQKMSRYKAGVEYVAGISNYVRCRSRCKE